MRWIVLLLLCGCTDEVIRTEIAGETTQEERTVGCTHSGYCYTCLPGFDGRMKCSIKLSPYCPGNRKVLVNVTPIERTHESGKVTHREKVDVVKQITVCH